MYALPSQQLYRRSLGRGPDLVLLHGWGLHSGIWEPVLEQLAERFRLHLVDLPGHGRSAATSEFTLGDVCDALLHTVPEQADWLGWSLGGMLALEFAARYPLRVRRLVLTASNPKFVMSADWPHAMAPDVLDGFARALEQDHDGTLMRFLALIARGGPDNGVLRVLRDALRKEPPPATAGLRGGLRILRDEDLRARIRQLDLPVLLLGGARDSLVPIEALRVLAQAHPLVRLHEFQQAGHAPFISHPQEFANVLAEFLA